MLEREARLLGEEGETRVVQEGDCPNEAALAKSHPLSDDSKHHSSLQLKMFSLELLVFFDFVKFTGRLFGGICVNSPDGLEDCSGLEALD